MCTSISFFNYIIIQYSTKFKLDTSVSCITALKVWSTLTSPFSLTLSFFLSRSFFCNLWKMAWKWRYKHLHLYTYIKCTQSNLFVANFILALKNTLFVQEQKQKFIFFEKENRFKSIMNTRERERVKTQLVINVARLSKIFIWKHWARKCYKQKIIMGLL